MSSPPPPRGQLFAAYAVLYLVWGSTYLAMKLAVQTLPPFTTASLRFVFSGLLLLVVGLWLDAGKTRLTARHLLASVGQGVLLLVLGNAAVMFAMKTVPSGVAALILATTPLFMALLARATGDASLRPLAWIGIALGMVGIGVLVDPLAALTAPTATAATATTTTTATATALPTAGVLLLVFAAFSWAVGSLLPKKLPPHPSNLIATGIQMLTGAVVQFVIGRAVGEHIELASTSAVSWWALVYLAVFGSLLGFTCYGWLLKVEPAARVATYAYVNPVVAVVLGAAVGHEAVSARVVVAGAIIVVAVVLILKARDR